MPMLAEGLASLTRALDEAVSATGLDNVPYRRTKGPWRCDEAHHSAFSYGYDVKVANPRSAVKAVLRTWTQRGYVIQEDNSDAPVHPEVYLATPLLELSAVAFPERGEVWIAGNTVCLAGEVPEGWRDV
jgi:hypothetical protein